MRKRLSFLDFLSPATLMRLHERAALEQERDELARMMQDHPGAQPRGTEVVRIGTRLRQRVRSRA